MADVSMASTYKVLKVLRKSPGGVSHKKLRITLPFLDVSALLKKLEGLGYVTHRITARAVKGKRYTQIRHEEDDLWYMTPLGETALKQYTENNPPVDLRLVVGLIAVAAVCVFVFYMILR